MLSTVGAGSSKRKLVTKLNLACIRDTDSILASFKCHYGHKRLNEALCQRRNNQLG